MKEVQGYQTAISRTKPPAPMKWLHDKNLITGRALDYGSGRMTWYGIKGYDPYWRPTRPTGKFDTIICNYVLNVVNDKTQRKVVRDIKNLLSTRGVAFITVRRDLPRSGKEGKGTFQRYVVLNLPFIRKTSGYEIYVMRK